MIIVQTPLRVSLFGGGTDFRDFYAEEGGCVLSSAIDKYIFVIIKQRFDRWLRVGYTRTEIVATVNDIQHELIREALRKTAIQSGVEITTMGDIPSAGSGLGSSSAVTVGALNAMHVFRGDIVPAAQLAAEACEIEIDTLHKPIGVQDQYITAFGGLRFIEFRTDGTVTCEPVMLATPRQRQLHDSLMLFFTGITRDSASVLCHQQRNLRNCRSLLRDLKSMACSARAVLEAGDVATLGRLLHESWQIKKRLADSISNGTLEGMYQTARQAGALGGKIAGAGGGGFLLLVCPPERQDAVRAALANLQELPFQLERDGSKVIFNYRR